MNESSRVVLDAETPVNPYSLLEAVNRSSNSANAAWLIYLALMTYLLVTVAGVGHKDLLLNSDITLPVLQVKIELSRFFLFAPVVLVLVHMGVIGQLVLLARKTLEFAASVRMLESSDQRSHPLRLELDNFFFVQAVAGPDRSRVVGALLHGMSWLTLVILPVVVLLYVQAVFLPYHDASITWVHRTTVLCDIALLVFVGMFLWRLETSFFRAFWRTSLHHPISLTFTALLLAAFATFSMLVATIPEESSDTAANRDQATILGYAVPGVNGGDHLLLGFFARNLRVSDTDMVVDKDVSPGEISLNLRGRDLRFAKLDRSDLHQADLTGANLDGASLSGADLRGVWLQCGDLNALLLTDDRSAARCTSARSANLTKARLGEAKMAGIDLRGARLDDAQMEGAQLSHGLMHGASFAGARLDRADLSSAQLVGANFLLASLQGADLTGAKLQLADFSNAGMQGADLSLAGLEGARLRDAELEGANLQLARLLGADMAGTKLQGSDMTGALVWRTTPPGGENSAFADMALIVMRPPGASELAALKAALASIADSGSLKTRLADGAQLLADSARNGAWDASSDHQLWQGFARSSEAADGDGYKGRLTDFLNRLMCRSRFASGAVATGVAKRAMATSFKGDLVAIYDKLRSTDCPAAPAMSGRLMRDLATAADAGRGQ